VYPDARNPFAHPDLLDVEGLEPWIVPELWIMGPGGQQAGVAVDTTDTVDRKVAALMCHKSQMPDPDGVAQRVRDWARGNGELAGFGDGRSAELFRVIRIP
jgi:LmbE family N-acetylglucosaminyl deacetylase